MFLLNVYSPKNQEEKPLQLVLDMPFLLRISALLLFNSVKWGKLFNLSEP